MCSMLQEYIKELGCGKIFSASEQLIYRYEKEITYPTTGYEEIVSS